MREAVVPRPVASIFGPHFTGSARHPPARNEIRKCGEAARPHASGAAPRKPNHVPDDAPVEAPAAVWYKRQGLDRARECLIMAEDLYHVGPESVLAGWDFSTGGVKCLAFDLDGHTLAEVRLPTDLWSEGGVRELNLMQLEGQARASVRAMAARLRALGRLGDWVAGGI